MGLLGRRRGGKRWEDRSSHGEHVRLEERDRGHRVTNCPAHSRGRTCSWPEGDPGLLASPVSERKQGGCRPRQGLGGPEKQQPLSTPRKLFPLEKFCHPVFNSLASFCHSCSHLAGGWSPEALKTQGHIENREQTGQPPHSWPSPALHPSLPLLRKQQQGPAAPVA